MIEMAARLDLMQNLRLYVNRAEAARVKDLEKQLKRDNEEIVVTTLGDR